MILVVAWDGADLGLIEPWIADGELPEIAALIERGATRSLASTRPPVTFPAWTSFMTAATPDCHGIPDFTIRDGYRVRFANAADRRLPTVFALMTRAGLRVGTYGLPATYPPEPLSAFQIPGFDTPFGVSPAARHGHPADLVARLLARHGSLAVEGPSQARIDAGWHRVALARMLRTIDERTEIFAELVSETEPDCALVHFMESDTVSHQFRQFCDPRSPRYRLSDLEDAMLEVYRALDRALGRLVSSCAAGDTVLLLSDHGSAATSDRAIFWNRWLADSGRLAFERGRAVADAAAALKQMAVRSIPPRMQARLFASLSRVAGRMESATRFAGIDWAQTSVFSEELAYQPSFWLNLRGREPHGVVDREDAPKILHELRRDLLALHDPLDGRSMVRETWLREELYDGAYAARMPDLVAELDWPGGCAYAARSSRAGQEPSVVRRLGAEEMTGARGTSMPGCHSPFGLAVAAGPAIRPGRYPASALEHAGATLLALAGVAPTQEMNGRPWGDCLAPAALGTTAPAAERYTAAEPELYSRGEEALVGERLRALGYID